MRPLRICRGFSLVEMLVAMAVLTMLMTFMFGLLAGTIRLWEQGNNQVEAAQAARIGLNRLAEDLRGAISGSATSLTPSGASVTSVIPFFARSQSTAVPSGWSAGNFVCSEGGDQIFGIRATGKTADPYNEFGYFSVFVSRSNGYETMRGQRYYLVRHLVSSTNTAAGARPDFFLRSAGDAWVSSANTGQRFPIIDNCLRVEFEYASTNVGGVSWSRAWSSQTNLPIGVIATVLAIDSRTAERVAKLNNGAPLTAAQISSITNAAAASDPVSSLLRQSGVVMRRFIPFPNAK